MMSFEHGLQPQLPVLAKLCDLLPKLPVWLGFPTCKMGNERQPEPMMGNVGSPKTTFVCLERSEIAVLPKSGEQEDAS